MKVFSDAPKSKINYMALSRIWSAFIIIAVLVAGYKFFAVDGDQQIFTQMVIGKNGDSLKVKEMTADRVQPSVLLALDTQARVKQGNLIYKKEGDKIAAVKQQKVNGIIETCKDAVSICIGLIGVMTLFWRKKAR